MRRLQWPGFGLSDGLVVTTFNAASLSASCSYGWRISLGLAVVPATVLALGGIFLPDSPNSLIERGHKEKGRAVLVSIRGTEEVDAGARQGGRRRALCSLARVGAGRVGCHGMPR